MEINYGSLIQKYLAAKARNERNTNAHAALLDEKKKITEQLKKIEPLAGTKIKEISEKLTRKLHDIEAAIQKQDEMFAEDRKALEKLMLVLHDFTVSMDDVLHTIFPNFQESDYEFSFNNSFCLTSSKPASKELCIAFCEKDPAHTEQRVFFTITLKHKKTLVETVFYKFYNLNEVLADNSLLKDNLFVVRRMDEIMKKYRSRLMLPPEKIRFLNFSVLDFYYCRPLQNFLFAICERKKQKEQTPK